jgi:hypothetical protein
VPSSVWIAATAAGRSLDDLLQAADLSEAGGRSGPRSTEPEALRGEVTEVGRRCGALAEQVARLQEEVAETGATLALVVDAPDPTGVLTGRGSRRRASRGRSMGLGNAFPSRARILAAQQWQLLLPRPYDGTEPSEPRAVVLVRIKHGGRRLWVGSTHLPRRTRACGPRPAGGCWS